MVYLLTYDLNKPGQNNEALYEAIEKYPSHYRCLRSVWLLDTSHTAEQIYNHLKPYILDQNDYVLIIQVTKPYYGWLSKDAWDWIEKRI